MILKVANLNKSFRHPWKMQKIQVLKNVNFEIPFQSITGFLGANGSGKTTTIKCLLGLLKYQSGKLEIFGKPHLHNEVKKNLGYLPERPFFYNYLTTLEFLKFYGQLSGMSSKEISVRTDELLELVGLAHAKKLYLKQFSKGMLQRVGMAQALIHKPKLLILDEPLSGLDPDGRRQLIQIIQNAFDNEKTSIFFSSHLLDDIDRLCQSLVLIKDGQIHFNGSKSDFTDQGVQSYLIRYCPEEGFGKESESSVGVKKIQDIKSLQKEIDRLRAEDCQILSIEKERMSLDRAFKKWASDPSNKSFHF